MIGSRRAGLRATILRNRRIDNFGQKYCFRMVRKFKAMRRMAGAQAAAVFLEGVVQHQVQAVLDPPVTAHQVSHACGPGVYG